MDALTVYYKLHGSQKVAYFYSIYQYIDWVDMCRAVHGSDFKITNLIDSIHNLNLIN